MCAVSQPLCVGRLYPSQIICAGNGHLLRVGPFIIARRYSYARLARFAPGSDEAIVLAAMRQARFSLWRIERRHPITGLILRDLLRGEETWLVDEAMEKNAPPGVEMAARLLQPETFAMTARIIVPVLPDLMPRPDLMDEVLTRAPALKRLQGDGLARDPRFAIGIYRAAVATGAMERVRFKRKRASFMWTDA